MDLYYNFFEIFQIFLFYSISAPSRRLKRSPRKSLKIRGSIFFPSWYNKNQSPIAKRRQIPSILWVWVSLDRLLSNISRNVGTIKVIILKKRKKKCYFLHRNVDEIKKKLHFLYCFHKCEDFWTNRFIDCNYFIHRKNKMYALFSSKTKINVFLNFF